MDYQKITELFKTLNERVESAREEMRSHAKPLIEASANQLFDLCPEIKSVYWTQYTPYFNDGDSCQFSVHSTCFSLVDDEEEFNPYESSVLFTEADLKSAEDRLEDAKLYEQDPEAWKTAYKKRYKETYGRDYMHSVIKPYGSVEDRQEEVEEIKAFLTRYSSEAIDRIKNAFTAFERSLAMIDEDTMKVLYGDHSLVQIDRTGTTVEEFDHE